MTEEKKPAYLKTHKITGPHLAFFLGEEEEAQLESARASKSGRASKTLVKDGRLRLTLVAMRESAELKEHTVEGPSSFQCLRGSVRFQLEDEAIELTANSLLVLDTGVSHDVTALRDSTFLITISLSK